MAPFPVPSPIAADAAIRAPFPRSAAVPGGFAHPTPPKASADAGAPMAGHRTPKGTRTSPSAATPSPPAALKIACGILVVLGGVWLIYTAP